MKHLTKLIAASLFLLTTINAQASLEFNTIDSHELMQHLNAKKPLFLLDIQKKKSFLLHHFFNSLETNAYPVKNDKDTGKINKVLARLQDDTTPIIIIGPRGTRASQRAFAYLVEAGISPQRVSILEKGIRGWPTPEILQNTAGQ